MTPTTHSPEDERLAALARYEIMDSPDEAAFDEVAELASAICGTPIAVVNFIAENRQWFKAEVGLGVKETPLESSFCVHALLEQEMLVIPDTTKDARFCGNPLVIDDPFLRFYAGALLRTPDGYALGTLCVLDSSPRTLTDQQLASLRTLARQVMTMLELRRMVRRQHLLHESSEAALRSQQRVLAMVSHDLRTPLATVRMGADILQEEEGHVGDIGKRIGASADAMIRLAEDLVDEEGLRRGSLSLHCAETPVRSILRDAVDRFEAIANAVGVELHCEALEHPGNVHCDPDRILQALANLLSNAIAHTPRGGRVTLQATRRDDGLCFVVSDTGPGIRDEDMDKIFEPFWRPKSGAAQGMGLGLAIVRTIIEAHGGSVHVTNRSPGAAFELRIPDRTNTP